jgi:hypothetical protein
MKLPEILEAFMRVEAGLEVSEPAPVALKRTYPLLPPASAALETPCIMHQYRRVKGERIVGARISEFDIRVQLLVAPASGPDVDVKSQVAAAFDEEIVAAFDNNVLLDSTTAFQRIVEEQRDWQPAVFEWNGVGYIGCEYLYRVTSHEVGEFA